MVLEKRAEKAVAAQNCALALGQGAPQATARSTPGGAQPAAQPVAKAGVKVHPPRRLSQAEADEKAKVASSSSSRTQQTAQHQQAALPAMSQQAQRAAQAVAARALQRRWREQKTQRAVAAQNRAATGGSTSITQAPSRPAPAQLHQAARGPQSSQYQVWPARTTKPYQVSSTTTLSRPQAPQAPQAQLQQRTQWSTPVKASAPVQQPLSGRGGSVQASPWSSSAGPTQAPAATRSTLAAPAPGPAPATASDLALAAASSAAATAAAARGRTSTGGTSLTRRFS